jgi:ABC-type branched-subunit amino acid transport system permease subunit
VAQASFFTIAIYIVAIFALINWPEISRHHTDQELADLYDKMPFGLTPWLILLAGAVGNVLFIVLGVIVFCVCKGRFKKIIQISRYTAKPSTEPPIQPAQQA